MITPRTKPSSFFPEEAADDLFVVQQRKAKLEGYVQTLAAMDELIDFAAMAAAVDKACPRADRSKGGRPPYPTEALVRMVFLQGLYNLSDEQCEHQVLDRMSFQRFCRLDGALNIPDARTLWNFRQRLAEGGLGGRAIFEALSQQLQRHGFIPRGGQIVDASIVQAPITQANARERDALNKGEAPEGWSKKRLAHTDRDARWTQKHGKSYYGYKLHGNVDARYKLIRQMKITAANADDGQQLPDVLQVANTRKRLLADRGYDSAANRQTLQQHGLADGIARRAKPGQTAKVRLKQRNKTINRTRARVEHVFAALSQQGGKCVRAMTLARNALAITLQCAAYNARRLVWLVKSAGPSAQPA
ncbi:IS5 family transposase [Sphaerotilus montanus]|uniref:IS5 family transposase n=11 Tax=Sphaerotilus montanus TaxID=522889 RepID=A0A7Y9QX40_9BURK|nr:IS5 family transposase [Sphaerotilus montanus]NYG31652.1 IS5 family transposase [Sphaerotilus montanus]NYG32166.1 IS5 family transposase [Sphaerotilus montanus]NYG32759.1 IS5 family transposase [Sphaerotilus montanus]NYG33067.1 IS5 family transposase [Sphaerotilus montanus]NYG33650.1 IS5 family transposase [Sphaerotilus montanus]